MLDVVVAIIAGALVLAALGVVWATSAELRELRERAAYWRTEALTLRALVQAAGEADAGADPTE